MTVYNMNETRFRFLVMAIVARNIKEHQIVNSLTEIERIMYPVNLQIICNQH